VFVSSKSFVDYSTSGLENPLTHLLYVLFLARLLGVPLRAGRAAAPPPGKRAVPELAWLALPAALMACNRLDSLLLVAPALVERAVRERRDRRALLGALVAFAPLFLWELFSLVYYGFLFPNTAYAKLGAGIAGVVLAEQGLLYYLSQLSHDPISLLVIAVGLGAPLLARERRLYAVAAGVALYLLYIVKIGGDFMAGRFFAAPLLGATVLIVRCLPALVRPGAVPVLAPAAVVATLAFVMTPRPTLSSNIDYNNDLPPKLGGAWDSRGVADERAFYFGGSGLLRVARGMGVPMDGRATEGRQLVPGKAVVMPNTGARGFYAPAGAIVVDPLGLTDPLIARLPARDKRAFRIGHFDRDIPDGYLPSLESGQNQIKDPDIAELYRRLRVVTEGPIWRWERWKEIARFNLGGG
jgi:arabinofuranosyltransferase